MPIDFQPIQSNSSAPAIDFQPIVNAVNAQPTVQQVQAAAPQAQPNPSLLQVAQGQQPQGINPLAVSPTSSGAAAIAGMNAGTGAVLNKTAQLGTDIAQGIGAISPQTRDNVNNAVGQFTDPSASDQAAMAAHPGISGVAEGATTIGLATAAGLGLTSIGSGLMGEAAAGAMANGVIGAASSANGFTNRLIGAGIGAGAAAAINVAAKGVTALANSLTVKSTLDKTLNAVNSKIQGTPIGIVTQAITNRWNAYAATSSQMFDSFRSVPGDFSTDVYKIGNQIHDVLDTYADTLTPVQKSILNSGLNIAKNGSSIADIHDIRLALNADYDKFLAHTTGQPIYTAFTGLMAGIDNTMKDTATKAGVLDTYLTANNFYKTQMLPLQQFGAKDVANATASIAKANAAGAPVPLDSAKTVTGLIDKYVKPGQADITKSFMDMLDDNGQSAVRAQVLNNVVDKATATNGAIDYLKLDSNLSKLKGTYAQVYNTEDSHALIQGLRTVINNAKPILEVLPTGASGKEMIAKVGALGTIMMGGLAAMGPAGAIATGGAALALKSLSGTPTGQLFLKAIGTSSMGTQLVSQAFKSTAAMAGGMHNVQVNTPPHDEHSAAFLADPASP